MNPRKGCLFFGIFRLAVADRQAILPVVTASRCEPLYRKRERSYFSKSPVVRPHRSRLYFHASPRLLPHSTASLIAWGY